MSSTTTKVSTVRDNLNSTKLGVVSDAIARAPLGDILSILLDTRNANTTISAVTATGAVTPTLATSVLTATAVSAATAVSPASAAYASPDQSLVAALVNSLKTQVNACVTDIGAINAKLGAAVVDITALATKLGQAVVDIFALRSEMATINTAGTIGGATETGLAVAYATGVCAPLAQAPTTNGLITVNATAVNSGSATGVKKLIRDSGHTLATGEVYWDGGVNLKFAIADAVTACDVIYAKSDLTQRVSCLLRSMPE
jgi:hypothetical protein